MYSFYVLVRQTWPCWTHLDGVCSLFDTLLACYPLLKLMNDQTLRGESCKIGKGFPCEMINSITKHQNMRSCEAELSKRAAASATKNRL